MKRNPATEISKSAIAAAVAVLMIGLTWTVYRITQPSVPDAYARVGQSFFEPFESQQIAQMDLAAVDADGQPLTFSLKRTNGLWTIPSHYGYPAEAAERLSRTATELLGLERQRLASSEKGAQALLGTLDPSSDEGRNDPENAGKLLRFTDVSGEDLFHLIIGKRVEPKAPTTDSLLGLEQTTESMYYVRVPGEKESYVAKLDLDISTRFVDWIEADLLELSAAQMRELRVDNSRLESRQVLTNQGIEVRRARVPGEELKLTKPGDFDPWQVPDLQAEQEEMKVDAISPLVTTIENVELIGVRPRFKYQEKSVLGEDLSFQFPPELAQDLPAQQAIVDQLQDDLLSRGFGLTRDPESNDLKLVSDHGELSVTTSEGLVYTLYFGSQITGTEDAIQIGDGKAPVEDAAPGEEAAKEDEAAPPAEADAAKPGQQTTGRFLMVRVAHDPEKMTGRPVQPIEPERLTVPDGVGEEKSDPAATSDKSKTSDESEASEQSESSETTDKSEATNKADKSDQSAASEASDQSEKSEASEQSETSEASETSDKSETSDTADQSDKSEQSDAKLTREQMQAALDAQYEQQKAAYEEQQRQYALDVMAFEERVSQAAEKARRLSQRFADWYYVVPSGDLDRLRLTRSEVVKAKDLDPANPLGLPGGDAQAPPGLPPGFQLPPGFELPPGLESPPGGGQPSGQDLPPSQLPNQGG